MKPSRFLFTGDPFRTVSGERAQLANVEWLERTLGDLLRTIARLPSETALPLAASDVAEFVALQGGKVGLDNWAKIFWERAKPSLVSAMKKGCEDSLVLSIEMPPVLQDALDRAGIPWIDVGVSPLRFLPDLALHLRASRHFNLYSASSCLLQAADIQGAVRHVGNWYRPVPITEPTVVFFSQTSKDRTLIKDGHFCDADDIANTVAPFVNGRPFLIKPHPWQRDSTVVSALSGVGGEVTELETYALLANPCVEVITLSSSVGREALAFGRQTTIISPSVQDWAYSGVDVMQHAQSQEFWSTLLASAGLPVSPATASLRWLPNTLRATIGGQGLDMAVWKKEHG